LASFLFWGAVVGAAHFMLTGLLYGNPVVDRVYAQAMASEPGVRRWDSKPRYLVTQLAGTQLEIYLLMLGFWVVRPGIPISGLGGALVLGLLLGLLRVYPRFWNMWIQSTYPRRLLAIEIVNGLLGSIAVVLLLQLLSPYVHLVGLS
jgi:hypothetical protein